MKNPGSTEPAKRVEMGHPEDEPEGPKPPERLSQSLSACHFRSPDAVQPPGAFLRAKTVTGMKNPGSTEPAKRVEMGPA